ncbi:MAG: sensor histidine kinase [Spirochaetia bacterium]
MKNLHTSSSPGLFSSFLRRTMVLLLVPLCILLVITGFTISNSTKQDLLYNNRLISNSIIQNVEDFFRHVNEMSSILISELENGSYSEEMIQSIMATMVSNSHWLESIILLNPEGRISRLYPRIPELRDISLENAAFVRPVLQGNEHYISSSSLSIVTGNSALFSSYRSEAGIIIFQITLGFIQEHILTAGEESQLLFSVIDRNGIYMGHSISEYFESRRVEPNFAELQAAAEEGSLIEAVYNEQDYFVYAQASDAYPWLVAVYQKKSTALQWFYTYFLFTVFLLIFTLGVAVLISAHSFSSILSSVSELKKRMRQVAEGNLQQRIQLSAYSELDEFAAEFNKMTDRLAYSREELTREFNQRRAMVKQLQYSNERFRNTIRHAPIPIVVYTEDMRLLFSSTKWDQALGFEPEENQDFPDELISSLEDKERWTEVVGFLRSGGENAELVNLSLTAKKGDNIVWDLNRARIGSLADGTNVYVIMATDITKRVNYENHISASLREKNVLLKEIHHRVKNNMQIIVSLLNLQSSTFDDEQLASVLEESRNRIDSMALVHELLYKSENLSKIDMADYGESIFHGLLNSYPAGGRVEWSIDVQDVFLDIEKAVPCGLIMNEAISNALKYAFPEKNEGILSLHFFQSNNQYQMIIQDNGVGMELSENKETLGLQLIYILADQLSGKISVQSKDGVRIILEFPKTENRTE